MTLIATASAADEIAEIWWLVAWAGLILSAVLCIVALTLSMVPRGNRLMALRIAVVGGSISLIPVLFALHIYRIDFVAVGGDGTPASPPLLSALALPLLPFLACLAAAGIAIRPPYDSYDGGQRRSLNSGFHSRNGCAQLLCKKWMLPQK